MTYKPSDDAFAAFFRDVLSQVSVNMERAREDLKANFPTEDPDGPPVDKEAAVTMEKCRVCNSYFEPHPLMVRWNNSNHKRNKYLCLEHWK